jgi:sterol 14-demethylase
VVYDAPNDKFMEQKKFVKAGLSITNLRAYVRMIEEEVADYLAKDPAFQPQQAFVSSDSKSKKWDGQFDVLRAMQEITILTAARTLQGKEVRDNLDKGYAALYADLDGGFTPIHMMFPYLPLESSRKRDRAQKLMQKFYVDIIRKRTASGEFGSGKQENLEVCFIVLLRRWS